MKKMIKDIHGHEINRERIFEIVDIIDKKENEQRIKIYVKKMGECGMKTILLHKGPTFLSQTKINRIKDYIYSSKDDIIQPSDLKELLYGY